MEPDSAQGIQTVPGIRVTGQRLPAEVRAQYPLGERGSECQLAQRDATLQRRRGRRSNRGAPELPNRRYRFGG